ncbi:Serine/arginine-rich SC35-like splicing factor SCL28-like protein [Drosera capensis]
MYTINEGPRLSPIYRITPRFGGFPSHTLTRSSHSLLGARRYGTMARHRSRSPSRNYSRSRSRSRSPPRRKRYDDPRDRRSFGDWRSPPPLGLLVRNIPLDTRPEELRVPFERYGPVKDVYLPRNYYTGEPRGFGFVKFRYREDAAKAKERLNHKLIGGREIRIVFAEESRRTPSQMRMTSRISSRYGGSSRRRSYSRSPRHRNHSYSRSPSPAGRYSRSRSRSYSPCDERKNQSSRRSYSPEDASPQDKKEHEARRGSESPGDLSPSGNGYRSSRRSPTIRETYPLNERGHTLSEKSPGSREVSPHAYPRSSKTSRGHKERSPCIDKKRASPSRSPTPTDQSHKSHKSNRRSLTPEENGRSAKHVLFLADFGATLAKQEQDSNSTMLLVGYGVLFPSVRRGCFGAPSLMESISLMFHVHLDIFLEPRVDSFCSCSLLGFRHFWHPLPQGSV